MAYAYIVNSDRSKVTGTVPGSAQASASAVPSLRALYKDRQRIWIPAATLPYMGAKGAGCTYLVGNDVPPIPVVEGTLQFQLLSGITPKFKRERGRGKVCTTERQIGLVRYSASGGVVLDPASRVFAATRGWDRFAGFGLPLAPHPVPIVNGRPNYCSDVLTYYDRFTVVGVRQAPDLLGAVLGKIKNGIILDASLFDRSPDTGVVTAVLAEANSKQFDLLTELAEFPETLLFVRDALFKIKDLCDEYEATRMKRASFYRSAEALAALWLSYRYAVMPIMYSVQDAIATYSDTIRRYAEFRGDDSVDVDAPDIDGYTASSTVSAVGRCYIKRGFSADMLLRDLWQRVQFNPVASAWELYPLSFVWDWVFNVSDCIIAITGDDACSTEGASWSTRTKGSFSYTRSDSTENAKFEIDFYHRIPIKPLAHTGLTVGNHMTWKRAIDAIALSFSALKFKRFFKR